MGHVTKKRRQCTRADAPQTHAMYQTLPRVRAVEALQVLEHVDLDDVVQAALAHVHVVVVGAVRQGHPVPVALSLPAAPPSAHPNYAPIGRLARNLDERTNTLRLYL